MQFTLQNSGSVSLEIGSLGFPAEFNSIFTGRDASTMLAECSLSDPYIGQDAGYIRVAPTSGTGAALVVTPLLHTPLEAYRNLDEPYFDDTAYGSQTFEGFYEWQVYSAAWAENEWAAVDPWNPASSATLEPGAELQFGLRFSAALDGVRGIDKTVESTGTPVARSVPGYILPTDLTAQLLLKYSSAVQTVEAEPEQFFGVSSWLLEFAKQVAISLDETDRKAMGTVYVPSSDERAYAWMLRQYGSVLSRMLEDLGSAEMVGRQLFDDLRKLKGRR